MPTLFIADLSESSSL